MAAHLIQLVNSDPQFYPTIGPFLARRDVIKAVGGPIWDDDTKTWLVLANGGNVLGFVSVTERGQRRIVESLWTSRSSEESAGRLIAAVVDRFGDVDLHATVARAYADIYRAAGFTCVGETTQFVKLTRKGGGHGR